MLLGGPTGAIFQRASASRRCQREELRFRELDIAD